MYPDLIGKIFNFREKPIPETVTAHRATVIATDKLPAITVTAADQTGQAGSLTAVSHGVAVAPGNAYGSVGASAIVTVTPTVNKSIDVTVPQSAGAEHYDVFLSTATTGPLWVGRITEAQRAAGCSITAVGTIGAAGPGGAGKVNVQVVGTGQASTAASFAQNNAYTPASVTAIDCTGYSICRFYIDYYVTDLRTAPSCNVIPFTSPDGTKWYAGSSQALNPLAAIGLPKRQVFDVDVRGSSRVVLLLGTIAGQGAGINVDYQLI